MRENPAFDPPPQSRIILRDFEAPVNVGEKYIQRLTAYLQVGMDFICLNARVVSEKKTNFRKLLCFYYSWWVGWLVGGWVGLLIGLLIGWLVGWVVGWVGIFLACLIIMIERST